MRRSLCYAIISIGMALIVSSASHAAVYSVTFSPNPTSFGEVAQNAGGGSIGNSIEVNAEGPPGAYDLSPLFNANSPYTINIGNCPTNLSSGSSCYASVVLDTTAVGIYDDDLSYKFTFTPSGGGETELATPTLVLTATVVAPAPAPSVDDGAVSWAMMVLGLASLGFAGHRRAKKSGGTLSA